MKTIELPMNAPIELIAHWFELGYDIIFKEVGPAKEGCACHDCVQFRMNMH